MTTDSFFTETAKAIADNYVPNQTEEVTIELFEELVRYSYHNHPGFFKSETIEKTLKKINHSWFKGTPIKHTGKNIPVQKVVHIVTTMYSTGGHTKILEKWIETDKERNHSVVIIRPNSDDDFQFYKKVELSGGFVHKLVAPTYHEKAIKIRTLIEQTDCELIVFHTHPEEIISFIATDDLIIPKVIVNHADHAFWVGATFVDAAICIREEAARINYRLRNIARNYIVPMSIRNSELEFSKIEAKKKLKLNPEKTLFISVGSFNKFRQPQNEQRSFAQLIKQLNNSIENPQFIIIGPGEKHRAELGLEEVQNVQILDPEPEPFLYYAAADFIIDPIPLGSYTSLLEGVSYGAYPLLYNTGIELFDLSLDQALKVNGINSKDNFNELIEQVNSLISDPLKLQKVSEQLSQSVKDYHSEENFDKMLNEFYNHLREKKSLIHQIEKSTELDLGLKFRRLSERNPVSFEKFLIKLMQQKKYFNFKSRLQIGWNIIKNPISRQLANSIKFALRFISPNF